MPDIDYAQISAWINDPDFEPELLARQREGYLDDGYNDAMAFVLSLRRQSQRP